MPKDSGYHQREENPHQGASHSFGRPHPQEAEPTDRERAIETGREGVRQTPSVGRPQAISSAVESNASPFTVLRRMADDMDRMFRDFGVSRATWTPEVEAFRRGERFVVRADLPGLRKDDVQVEVEGGMLTISGERCLENEDDRDDVYRSERVYGQFYRAIALPDNVNVDDCDASFKDGVLEITFDAPRQAEKGARRIEIT